MELVGAASCKGFWWLRHGKGLMVDGGWFTLTVAPTVGATVTSPDTLIPIKAQRKAEVIKTSCGLIVLVGHAPPRMSPALVQHFLSFYSQRFLFLSSSADQQED